MNDSDVARKVPFFWLSCFAVGTVMLAEAVIARFSQHPVRIGAVFAADNAQTRALEAAARTRMLGLAVLLCLYSLTIIVKMELERRQTGNELLSRRMLRCFIALSVIPAVLIALAAVGFATPTIDLLGQDVFEEAFRRSGNWHESGFVLTLRSFWWIQNVVGLIVGISIAALLTTSYSYLAPASASSISEQATYWRYQSQRLQMNIYLGTGILVFGLLYLQCWTQWPSFLLEAGADATSGRLLAAFTANTNSYLMYTGIEYSMLLASFAVPCTYLLNRRAEDIASASLQQSLGSVRRDGTDHIRNAMIDEERKKQNIVIVMLDQLRAMVAILAPFVAGSMGNVLSLLMGKS